MCNDNVSPKQIEFSLLPIKKVAAQGDNYLNGLLTKKKGQQKKNTPKEANTELCLTKALKL